MTSKKLFRFGSSLIFGALVACTGPADSSMYLTGTEEQAVTGPNGDLICDDSHKVLLCHIPPGNPDNAHTICVDQHALNAHVQHHGDPAGACAGDGGGGDDGDDGDDGGGDTPPDDGGGSGSGSGSGTDGGGGPVL